MNDLCPLTTSSSPSLADGGRDRPQVGADVRLGERERARSRPALATAGSQLLADRVGAADRDGVAADALHREQRVQVGALGGERLAHDGHGQRVDGVEPAAVLRRDDHARRARCAASRSRMSGSNRSASSARSAMSAHGGGERPGLRLQRQVPAPAARRHGARSLHDLGRPLVEGRPKQLGGDADALDGGRAAGDRPAVRVAVQALDAVLLACSRCRRAAAWPGRETRLAISLAKHLATETSNGSGRPFPALTAAR